MLRDGSKQKNGENFCYDETDPFPWIQKGVMFEKNIALLIKACLI